MVKVKICGLTRPEDIYAVNAALPDYIGLVFAPSRRRVDIATAAKLKERLSPRIEAVGVFVNESAERIAEICKLGIIDLIQLHGNEDDEYIKKLKLQVNCPIIKNDGVPPLAMPLSADYLLFDSPVAGSGQTFDWNLIGEVGKPFFLAGGLSPENVAEAIQRVKPFAVDVSSGVEDKTSGLKDAEKIEKFIDSARRIT